LNLKDEEEIGPRCRDASCPMKLRWLWFWPV